MSAIEAVAIIVGSMGFGWHAVYFILRIVTQVHELYEKSDDTADPPLVWLRKELWWVEVHLAIPAQILHLAVTYDSGADGLAIGVLCFLWFFFWHDDHDDRWKRRRRKVAAKIKSAVTIKLPVPAMPAPAWYAPYLNVRLFLSCHSERFARGYEPTC